MKKSANFNLKWEDHKTETISGIGNMLNSSIFVDCTLVAEGQFLQAHKLILSACSPYFAKILYEYCPFDKNPIVVLHNIKFDELQKILIYIYNGQVDISADSLESFLKIAKTFKLKGISEKSLAHNGLFLENGGVKETILKNDGTQNSIKLDITSELDSFEPPSIRNFEDISNKVPINLPPITIEPEIIDFQLPSNILNSNKENILTKKNIRELPKLNPIAKSKFSEAKPTKISEKKLEPFKCTKCCRNYKRKGALSRHQQYECGVEPKFSCEICGSKFSYKQSLQRHLLMIHNRKGL